MSDYIKREELIQKMYHEAFETDTDLQRWDSGCWIRYKLFENILETIPSADVVELSECDNCEVRDESYIEAVSANGYDHGFEDGYSKGKAERKKGEWIPCSERLPEDLEIVNITWVNHRPMNYYADIKDKPFTATAIHHNDKWWWYSPICEDMLAEYGKSECDKMDADIEVTAWMPLPKPWKGADDEANRCRCAER